VKFGAGWPAALAAVCTRSVHQSAVKTTPTSSLPDCTVKSKKLGKLEHSFFELCFDFLEQELSYRQDSARRLGHSQSRDKERTRGIIVMAVVACNAMECDTKTLPKNIHSDLDHRLRIRIL